jgi:hypothetical protein
MRSFIVTCVTLLLALALPSNAAARQLAQAPGADASAALKATMTSGARTAVATLGRLDGFYARPGARITLPKPLARVETRMRDYAMGRYADEFVLAMNRTAEAAVAKAQALLLDAIQAASLPGAGKAIAAGGTAGTAYFRQVAGALLRQQLLPLVRQAGGEAKLAESFDGFVEQGSRFGTIDKARFDPVDYVTGKALDAVFGIMADQEKAGRGNPAGA